MRRRIAGIFALIALGLSFAETARAASCEITTTAATHHNMPGHAPAQPGQQHDSMPNCPLSGGQLGCSATASLPSANTTLSAPAQHVAAFFSSDVVLPHSLRTTAIFHPPRF